MRDEKEILNNFKLLILDNGITPDEFYIVGKFYSKVSYYEYIFVFTKSLGWEHLSISHKNKTPSWDVMCEIKDIFFKEDEVCVQYHPKKEDYVNNHPHCLHIWRNYEQEFITPPYWMVGLKEKKK